MNYQHVLELINANIGTLSVDEIKEKLQPFTTGMFVNTPILSEGTFFYRGRKFDDKFKKKSEITLADLIYPPAKIAKLGRVNRECQSIFYCATSKEALFFEIPKLIAGDELVITFWKLTKQTIVNNIGYTNEVFERLGAKRPCPQWNTSAPNSPSAVISIPENDSFQLWKTLPHDVNFELRRQFSEYFMCDVGEAESAKYKLTTAIGEMHFGDIHRGEIQDAAGQTPDRFSGIVYPSIRMYGNADNIAFLPSFVDSHLRFQKAVHVRIDSRDNSSFKITSIDSAIEFDANGNLKWLGRTLNWKVDPGQAVKFTATAGADIYGDYETGQDGSPQYWDVVDTSTNQKVYPT